MECAYCVAIVLICLYVLLNLVTGIVSLAPSFFIVEMCVVAFPHVTKT